LTLSGELKVIGHRLLAVVVLCIVLAF